MRYISKIPSVTLIASTNNITGVLLFQTDSYELFKIASPKLPHNGVHDSINAMRMTLRLLSGRPREGEWADEGGAAPCDGMEEGEAGARMQKVAKACPCWDSSPGCFGHNEES